MTSNKHTPVSQEDLEKLQAGVRGDMDDLRTAVRGDMDDLRTAVRGDMDDLRTAVRGDIDEVLSTMKDFIDQVNFEFGRVHERIDKVEQEIVDLRASHDRLLRTIDTFVARIDIYETEQVARDAQFNRLLDWAKKVSKQTGIPLEGF